MPQLLLLPDPRPLVERLGPDFFRTAPEGPGVYVMRDRTETVLYVGKAKNLRKRLAHYRVANPDRLPRRHLRLLRAVQRIELQPCCSEAAALARESALLRTLRPRFNRAGTWPGQTRFLGWVITSDGMEVTITQAAGQGVRQVGPLGSSVAYLHAALARLLWCAHFPERGVSGLPEGWFRGRHRNKCVIPIDGTPCKLHADELLQNLFAGQTNGFKEWILTRTGSWTHPFDLAVREADLEIVTEFVVRSKPG